MQLLKQHIEALIFCTESSISIDEIQSALEISLGWEVSEEDVRAAIEELREKYSADEYSFELNEIAEGFQFLTKKQYHDVINTLIKHKAKKKLSVPQMETLSIIAYKQPISKTEIEHIRGVNCDYAVQKLLEKDLIEIQGKGEGPGRPVLYGTSVAFMEYFGIKTPKDLPQLKDLHAEQNEIGTPIDSLDSSVEEVANSTSEVENPVAENEVVSETEETVITESYTEEIPDRKSIFMSSEAEGSNPESDERNTFTASEDSESAID